MTRFKKILIKILTGMVVLALLVVAGILEADLKYGKKMKEERQKTDKMAADLEKLNETAKNVPFTTKDLQTIYATNLIKETKAMVEETYEGMQAAEKKMISPGGYFLIYRKASELKETLGPFEKFVCDSLRDQNFFANGILNLSDREKKGKKISWENYYFENCSKDSAVSFLRQIKTGIVRAEIAMMDKSPGKKN